jgi:hypothetical protein
VPLLVPFDDGTVSLVGRRGTDVVMMLRVPKDLAVVALRALFEDTTRKERREVPRTVKAK